MKLLLIMALFGASASHALTCKSADGKIVLAFQDKLLMTICNPVAGKTNAEVCGNDEFILGSTSNRNGITKELFSSFQSKFRSTITMTYSRQAVTADFGSNYEVTSYKGNNTITAPIGILVLSCK